MKKNLSLLAIVLLAICLVGFAYDRTVPAGTVHAAGETDTTSGSAGPTAKLLKTNMDSVPLTLPVRPFAWVVTGLVCVLSGIMAIAPLLIEDTALRRGAGIYLGGTGFPHEPGEEDGLAGDPASASEGRSSRGTGG
jgi:hypothetical protein